MFSANKPITVYENGEIVLREFKPSMVQLFYLDMEPLTVLKRIQFLIDSVYGYTVYYLYIDGEPVGYCTITSGKNSRYTFASDKDIMIGSYFVKDECRGKGYASALVKLVISECKTEWDKGFLYIKNKNVPSIHVAQNIGAKFIFHARNTRLRKLIRDENGEFGIYMLQNSNTKSGNHDVVQRVNV